MPADLPRSIVICAWLNAWRLGTVTDTDAANALETLTGTLHAQSMTWLDVLKTIERYSEPFFPAVATPGNPDGLPDLAADQGVALSRNLLLIHTHEWSLRAGIHGVVSHTMAQAATALTETLTTCAAQLERLDTVGSRDALDQGLADLKAHPLPPSMPPRNRTLLDRSWRLWFVSREASIQTPSSRSQEKLATSALRHLEHVAQQAMCAAVTY